MDLRARSFDGFVTVAELASRPERVPSGPGVYAVLREATGPPRFLPRSPASWWKGKDPTVPVEQLEEEWVEGAALLYIGSGGDLRTRVGELVEFSQTGPGRSVRHWGGRLLWQVEGSQAFLVAWKATAPTCFQSTERDLVDEFTRAFGRMPFANLRRPPGR